MLKIQPIYNQFVREAVGPLPEYYKKKKRVIPQQRGPRGQFASPVATAQPAAKQQVPAAQQSGKPGIWDRLRGAWDSFKNPTQQTPTSQTQVQSPQAPINPKELATSLQQATQGFAKAYNAQIKPYKASIEIVNNAVQGLLSMPPYQQLNPQIGSQVQEFVTILQNATQQEAIDAQFISQVSQKAQSLSKMLLPQQSNKASTQPTTTAIPPLAVAASLVLTPRTGTPSFVLKLKY